MLDRPVRSALRIVFVVLVAHATTAAHGEQLRRGEYVFRAAGCTGCHTDSDNNGPWLAGGRALHTPFGTFHTPNITPHPQYGIGRWRLEDFERAMREGIDPDGRHYYPAFPYTSYTRLRRQDVTALWDYLRTVPPVARANRSHDLPWYLSFRPLLWFWKSLFFEPGEFVDRADRSAQWNRGAYLAQAMAHCAECHTPRNLLGALELRLRYAGVRDGPEGESAPNITPHNETGIGRWSADDIAYYLQSGATPVGDYAGGLMAAVIDEGLGELPEADLVAIAAYLKSLSPIENRVLPAEKKPSGANEFDY